jgi:hypothetical protein
MVDFTSSSDEKQEQNDHAWDDEITAEYVASHIAFLQRLHD